MAGSVRNPRRNSTSPMVGKASTGRGVPWFNFALMYKKGQIIETELFDTADKNRCVGKLDDGIRVFVEGTAAVGDTVRAEIYKTKKRYLVAQLKEILKFSDRRTEPRCKYFGFCGGWERYRASNNPREFWVAESVRAVLDPQSQHADQPN